MLDLRPYQDDTLRAIDDATGRILVVLPTGSGKTVCFAHLIRRRRGDALVLAHRDELLSQAANKLVVVAPELRPHIGFVKSERNDVDARVVIGSVQTLSVPSRLAQLRPVFRTVIVDEAHHATAPSYQRILAHVARSAKVVGFTATAERSDDGDLRTTFDTLAYARSLEEMIRAGYLCDLRALRINLDGLDLRRVRSSGGDYRAGDLGRAMQNAGVVKHVVSAYQQHAAGKRTVAFFPTVAISEAAAAAFAAAGVRAAHLDGETPRQQRREILDRLASGRLDVVCNVAVLTEGYDEPSLECIIIAAPTRSRIKFTQMVGRGTRLAPGKRHCLILDMAGASDDLTLQAVEMLFDLHEPLQPGESCLQAVNRERGEPAEDEYSDGVGSMTVESRDLFSREAIQWVRMGDRWVLALNDESLVLDPTGHSMWRVLLLNDSRARVIAKNLDLGYAQGAAEHLVRRHGTVELADKHAPWRMNPMSSAQRAHLRKLGVPYAPTISRGEATDLITEAKAADRLTRFDRAIRQRAA